MKLLPIIIPITLLLSGCGKQIHTTPDFSRRPSPPPINTLESISSADSGYAPHVYERCKAIWLSYIDLAPMLSETSQHGFEAQFDKACRNISELGCDTIYVHVRPFGDALYKSELFPSSAYLCGEYDPLDIICDISHKYGLSVHAWINPMRLQTADMLSQLSGFKTADWFADNSGLVCSIDGDEHLWLDPAYPEVRKLIAGGAAEIADNYDIDGIHYDDYFYPTTDASFDAQCFAEKGSGTLEEWRTENISQMCKEIYNSVKAVDSRIEVSISPQGNIENNYNFLYADVQRWCSEEGFCDRIIPQIYFGYDDPVKPYISTLKEWQDICANDSVKLTVGLAVYKIGNDMEFTDSTGIIARQIADCKECQGISLYAYNSFFSDNSSSERISEEKLAVRKALEKY